MSRKEHPANIMAIRILAVLLSILIWTWIQLNETTSSIQRVSLAFDRPEILIEVEELPKTVSVELSGAKGRLRQIEKIRLLLPVDLTDEQEGDISVTLDPQSILGLPDGIQVERLTPPILNFTLAKPFVREIPIRANLVGTTDEEYRVANVTITPPTLPVKGAESTLNQIQDIPTRILNIGGLNSNRTFSTQVVLPKSTLSLEQENLVTISIEMTPKNMDSVVSDVEVKLNSLDWNITPNKVSLLLNMPSDSSITADQIQLQIDINKFLKSYNPETTKEVELIYSENTDLFSVNGLGQIKATIKNIEPPVLLLTPIQ